MAELRYMSGRDLATRRGQRDEKLAWIRQQVADGELTIRQATAEECERFGIKPPAAATPRRARQRRAASVAATSPAA